MQMQSSSYRTWHRWLALIVGLQMVLWAVSGAYMVFFKLPFIHGVHLTQEADRALTDQATMDVLPDLLTAYPDVNEVQLVRRFIDGDYQDVAQLHTVDRKFLVNLDDLSTITLTDKDIEALAAHYYKKGEADITRVELLTDAAPTELGRHHLPIWRVDFDDFGNTSLYLHKDTGEMTVRRHDFWRGFDIMWMLHIMDYEDRTDITTWWLRAFILATFGFAFTGTILVLQTLRSSRRKLV